MEGTIKIKLVHSPICTPMKHKRVVKGLGLRKVNQIVVRPDRPEFRGIVRFHHVDERPLLTDLCRLIRNEHCCLFRVQNEFYVYELAGPKVVIRVAHRGPQIDRATAVLHRVIEKLDAAGLGRTLQVRGDPDCRSQQAARHLSLNFRKITLGDRKIRIDRVEPLDREERCGIGLHHVSHIHQARPGPTVDRRMDVAVFEVKLRGFEGCLRGFDECLVHVHSILLRVVVLL